MIGDIFYYGLLWWLIWPAGIIVLIVILVRRRKPNTTNNPLRVALSREDALSQLYFLLFAIFTGITLLALNRQSGNYISWRNILLVSSLIGLWVGYNYKALYTFAAAVAGLIAWWLAAISNWTELYKIKPSAALSGLILISLVLYVTGHLLEAWPKWKRFSLMFIVFGILFFCGVLFFLSTQMGLGAFNAMTQGDAVLACWQAVLSLLILVAGLVTLYYYTWKKHLILAPESLSVLLFALFALVVVVLPYKDMFLVSANNYYYYDAYQNNLSPIGVFWAVLFNVGLFLTLLGIILVGYVRRESWHVSLGIVLLFILILIKYFDWFFNSLDKSVFFIGAGVLMFVVGWLMERTRRTMIRSMKEVPNA